ncbi:MAG TPA: ACP S-malonyltransferase [Candidatus Merdenecus merdavium]|nr:ACP S-malonyltransferase [Candidatus Merdenecus merdavium]
MKKVAFIFPGQGAQYAGMGKDFYEELAVSKKVYDLASKVSGLNVAELCFTKNDQLNITEYTQIAMLATCVAMLEALKERGVSSSVHAGLSLGEYSALVASKALSLEDGFHLVRQRGIYMKEAVPTGGAMSAVLGMDTKRIEEICNETEGIVSIANFNCPGQIVITGEIEAVEKASTSLKEAGARRIVPLHVSGPFHSKMLETAGERLKEDLEKIRIHPLRVPYVSNVTAEYIMDEGKIKELLTRQVSSSVRWQQSVETMIKAGVTTFIEIGPGKTLAGFMKKIDKNVTTLNIEKTEDLDTVCRAIKE